MGIPVLQGAPASAAAALQAAGGEPAQYLTFVLGGEVFAIGILAIKEIIEWRHPTAVPTMPACVRGVINLRGAVVPVVDLAARFGRAPAPAGKRTCIVIIEARIGGERQIVGLVVDAVNEVLDIPAEAVEPPPGFGARIRSDFILGMGKVRERFVILLDVDRVLDLAGSEPAADHGTPAQADAHLLA